MITGRQIRAARALLDWDSAELAFKTGLTRQTISRIEADIVQPQEGTLSRILMAFSESGLEFTDNSGVRLKPQSVEVLSDTGGFASFYDYVYEEIKHHGGTVCVSGVDEKLFAKYRLNPEMHRERMRALCQERSDIQMRILVEEGDLNFVASSYATYRWQPRKHFSKAAFYVFGSSLALISFDNQPPPLIILIKSAAFADAYRNAFDIAWNNAIIPPGVETDGQGRGAK
ncbi:MAG: helix-turn-helix transcriptional regulator [Alphaproteobacteria bacterium]|nr:helix-turn-helix transcriptional regulator [Alphaproteobacteria bacterium]